jgi:hypothetical protein
VNRFLGVVNLVVLLHTPLLEVTKLLKVEQTQEYFIHSFLEVQVLEPSLVVI